MAVVLVQDGPTVTQERYDEVVSRMMGKDRVESPSDWPVEGLLVHATAQGPNGFRILDLWESEEAANRFGEVLGEHLEAVGITDPPEIYDAYTLVSA